MMGRGGLLLSILATSTVGSIISASHTAKMSASIPRTIFDFTSIPNIDGWVEQSDNVRTVGMSKATLTLQKTQVFQRAVFFALLNPQPNGAGFAGMRKLDFVANLENYNEIQLRCRSQGEFNGFKVILRHMGLNDEPNYTYEQMFDGPKGNFDIISLPLNEFKAYYRGRLINDAEPLNKSNITGFGIQFYGGVYLPVKQSGPATLEIDWIKAV